MRGVALSFCLEQFALPQHIPAHRPSAMALDPHIMAQDFLKNNTDQLGEYFRNNGYPLDFRSSGELNSIRSSRVVDSSQNPHYKIADAREVLIGSLGPIWPAAAQRTPTPRIG